VTNEAKLTLQLECRCCDIWYAVMSSGMSRYFYEQNLHVKLSRQQIKLIFITL